jgi:type II secretory pathway pseudopilin PulG
MAALLVAMAIMAVFMSVALPVWRQAAQREKEEELIWRGQQYDRALQLFRRKTSAPGAPNVDILISQKYLRRKYKDPITGGDFEFKPVGPGGLRSLPPGVPQPQRAEGQLIGGVRSRSKAKSIRLLNGRDHYDQWEFTYVPYNPNAKPPGTGGPGTSPQPGQQQQPPSTTSRPGTTFGSGPPIPDQGP